MINITETEKKELREFIKNTVIEVLAELQSSTEVSPDNLSIDEFLKKIGVPLHFTGFSYISTALELCMQKILISQIFLFYIRKLHQYMKKILLNVLNVAFKPLKNLLLKIQQFCKIGLKKCLLQKILYSRFLYHYKNHLY